MKKISEDVYKEFFKWKYFFFDSTNKKVIGKMKDEFSGVSIIIDEFVGLESKIYSMKKIDGKESNTAK